MVMDSCHVNERVTQKLKELRLLLEIIVTSLSLLLIQ